MSMFMQGRLPVDRLLTGRLTLDNINHGFDLLHEGEAIRQIVEFA
jgi:alcohol dehydrogenase